MKKIILLFITVFVITGCSKCDTEICIQEKIAMERIKQENIEKERLYEIERLKIKAEIEANKPTEVKVAEIQNSGMTVGEGVATAGGIAGAAWVISKILE